MNKYVVAYINFFDNVLLQTIVEAESETIAVLKYLASDQDITFLDEDEFVITKDTPLKSLLEKLFDMDCQVSVLKI